MDLTNIIIPTNSEFSESSVGESYIGQDMPKNSLFARNSEYQTYAVEKNDMGFVGWLLLGFVLLCLFFIRKLQRR
jgi:hypothetical protein